MEYKISKMVNSEPREWNGPHGTVYYIEVELEGHDKIVAVGKKTPDALKVGDTIYGEIVATDYLADKFKPSPPPQTASGSKSSTLDYEPSTNARWAIGMAYRAHLQVTGTPDDESGEFPFEAVKTHAAALLKMFSELKGGSDDIQSTKQTD